jgi:NAD-dependent dihydropyrimidine dehydrogenase PreA subunit
VGYPPTESGVELRILRRLFTEEEAEMACNLSIKPEGPEKIAERLGRNPEGVAAMLYDMSGKGLIFRIAKGDGVRYGAAMFVVGIYEYNLNNVDRELAREIEEYLDQGFSWELMRGETPQLRTIPVEASLDGSLNVQPYDNIRKIVERQSVIALADCICRKEQAVLGNACHHPREACLLFDSAARYYIENGIARQISKEQAFEVLRANEEAGLVPNAANSRAVGAVCSCCGCCCGVLRSLKKQPHPAALIKSNYIAQIDTEECTACEACAARCQMDAVRVEGTAVIDNNRCIGCGLCVSTCPTGAIRLKAKEDAYLPPASPVETYLQIASERGKI